ncbi:MAG: hypothetical protein M3355_02525 [Actinomycetota bacterium]|nr:hypothetical protein [Actinomycetota bacterium]
MCTSTFSSGGGICPSELINLQTEPWLFTIDKQGRVAARLEGSFGTDGFRRALDAALN